MSTKWVTMKKAFQIIKNYLLLITVVFLSLVALYSIYEAIKSGESIYSLLLNLATELIGIIVTVVIIDRIYLGREENEQKKRLVREVKSRDNADALKALEALKEKGWLEEKNLFTKKYFNGTNLSKGDLWFVDFSESNFLGVNFDNCMLINTIFTNCTFSMTSFINSNLSASNFKGAQFFEPYHSILSQALSMRQAIMPGGNKYDGRYLLRADELEIVGQMRKDISNVPYLELYVERKEVATKYFGISEQEFKEGAKWAVENMKINNQGLKNILKVAMIGE